MTTSSALATASLAGATLATSMVAGLPFSFAHRVMPGLRTLDDRTALVAFPRIDAAISNPWMVLTFLGSPVLTAAALALHVPGRGPTGPWLALALVTATIAITVALHLPLNAAIQDAALPGRSGPGRRPRPRRRCAA